ncbi:hypothetical protein QTO34_014403 [Cnephaeus nilssonii]|uniref:Phospholipid scramblase n=1 Tax=Cnephaeus nilssonii TaxID=3371016 RepID=A0AA40I6G2_CNENI|nr:hypothetical protein QTO34_014403 [Eptesicus nilssonii]
MLYLDLKKTGSFCILLPAFESSERLHKKSASLGRVLQMVLIRNYHNQGSLQSKANRKKWQLDLGVKSCRICSLGGSSYSGGGLSSGSCSSGCSSVCSSSLGGRCSHSCWQQWWLLWLEWTPQVRTTICTSATEYPSTFHEIHYLYYSKLPASAVDNLHFILRAAALVLGGVGCELLAEESYEQWRLTGVVAGVWWMPASPPPLDCPPGLAYFTQIDQIQIHQQVELLEVFTSFGTSIKYKMKNSLRQTIYFAVEIVSLKLLWGF